MRFALFLVCTVVFWCVSGVAALADHDDCTALHEAAFMNDPKVVSDLLARGTDINCLDILGQTPLVTAVNGASMESFTILVNAGADVDVRTEFGRSLLAHTKRKYASFTSAAGSKFRVLYGDMIARLQEAGAHN